MIPTALTTLSGKYDTRHPLPADSQRGETYNPVLPQLEELTGLMAKIGGKYSASAAQIAIAWEIHKGTTPIIGVTKITHAEDAAKAAAITLTADEAAELERLADQARVDTRGSWEHPMV